MELENIYNSIKNDLLPTEDNISCSMIQRKYMIGYPDAMEILEMLKQEYLITKNEKYSYDIIDTTSDLYRKNIQISDDFKINLNEGEVIVLSGSLLIKKSLWYSMIEQIYKKNMPVTLITNSFSFDVKFINKTIKKTTDKNFDDNIFVKYPIYEVKLPTLKDSGLVLSIIKEMTNHKCKFFFLEIDYQKDSKKFVEELTTIAKESDIIIFILDRDYDFFTKDFHEHYPNCKVFLTSAVDDSITKIIDGKKVFTTKIKFDYKTQKIVDTIE